MKPTAVVTGGNKGIGLETAKLLLERGFQVAVVARDFTDFPLAGQADVRQVPFDLSRVEDIPALARDLEPADVLVNNAGFLLGLPHDDYPLEASRHMIAVNLEAPVALIRGLSAGMARRGRGRIVNNASLAGQIGHPDVWYGMTKAGLINATKSFARLLTPMGVLVNAVAAGPAETDMLQQLSDARREQVANALYSGRFATIGEVAGTIVWLATDSPEYLSGVCIDLNNGAFPR